MVPGLFFAHIPKRLHPHFHRTKIIQLEIIPDEQAFFRQASRFQQDPVEEPRIRLIEEGLLTDRNKVQIRTQSQPLQFAVLDAGRHVAADPDPQAPHLESRHDFIDIRFRLHVVQDRVPVDIVQFDDMGKQRQSQLFQHMGDAQRPAVADRGTDALRHQSLDILRQIGVDRVIRRCKGLRITFRPAAEAFIARTAHSVECHAVHTMEII